MPGDCRLSGDHYALLGADFEELNADHLRNLIGLQESENFDAKSAHYQRNDSSTTKLAMDIAALANSSGGLIVIGAVEEGEEVTKLSPVPYIDDEVRRINQVALSTIVPHLKIAVRYVNTSPSEGYLLVLVPASTSKPHFVFKDGKLRAPLRRGAHQFLMTESEIADRYRSRFVNRELQTVAMHKLHQELANQTVTSGSAWLKFVTVPEYPGFDDLTIERLKDFKSWFEGLRQSLPYGSTFSHGGFATTFGIRRMIAADYQFIEKRRVSSGYFEFHTNGSVSGMIPIGRVAKRSARSTSTATQIHVGDDTLALSLLSLLFAAGQHAVRTRSGGSIDLLLSIEPCTGEEGEVELGLVSSSDRQFFPGDLYPDSRPIPRLDDITSSLSLSEISELRDKLTSATWLVLREVMSAFGVVTPQQFARSGAVNCRAFYSAYVPSVKQWAERNHIPTAE